MSLEGTSQGRQPQVSEPQTNQASQGLEGGSLLLLLASGVCSRGKKA